MLIVGGSDAPPMAYGVPTLVRPVARLFYCPRLNTRKRTRYGSLLPKPNPRRYTAAYRPREITVSHSRYFCSCHADQFKDGYHILYANIGDDELEDPSQAIF
jgi:hypothetical protein